MSDLCYNNKSGVDVVTTYPPSNHHSQEGTAMTNSDSITQFPQSANVFVYVIRVTSGAVKIGVTNDVARRVATLQTANHEELTLVYVFKCQSQEHALSLESAFHSKYQHHHIRGEWFDVSVEDIETDMQFAVRMSHIVDGIETDEFEPQETADLIRSVTHRVATGEADRAAELATFDGLVWRTNCVRCGVEITNSDRNNLKRSLAAHMRGAECASANGEHKNEQRKMVK